MRSKQKLLLTSSGLTGATAGRFTEIVGKPAEEMKILYIPTAGIETDAAREGIAVCLYELSKMGIPSENIFIYNLELILSKGYARTYSAYIQTPPLASRLLDLADLAQFDAVFVSGGDCAVLCREMVRTGFDAVLAEAIRQGLVYVGISAGSMYAASNLEQGLRMIPQSILPHSAEPASLSPDTPEIRLPNGSAVFVDGAQIRLLP